MGAVSALHTWIAISVAVALFFFLLAIFWLVRGLGRRREAFLMERLGMEVDEPAGPGIRIRDGGGDRPGGLAARPTVQRVQGVLTRSGIRVPAGQFLALSAGLVVGTGLMFGLATGSPLTVLIISAGAAVGLHLYVTRKHDRRIKQVTDQLPTALEMMIFSMRAGQNLEEAIHAAADEVDPPLAGELRRCYQEYSMGRPIEAALQQLQQRWEPVRPLTAFVEAVVVLKRTGGNIIEVMETLVENLRAQAAFEARHRSLTAEGRMSGLFLMMLPLLVLVIQTVMVPQQLLSMLDDGTGQTILVVAVILWGLGILWVNRLTRPAR